MEITGVRLLDETIIPPRIPVSFTTDHWKPI